MMLTASLAAIAMSAAIAGANDSPETPVEVTASQKEKMICRKEVGTGSIMPKRVCRTKAEWQLVTEKSKSDFDRTRDIERSKSLVQEAR